MATVQALDGKPFPHTNMWSHTWYSDTCNSHLAALKDIQVIY